MELLNFLLEPCGFLIAYMDKVQEWRWTFYRKNLSMFHKTLNLSMIQGALNFSAGRASWNINEPWTSRQKELQEILEYFTSLFPFFFVIFLTLIPCIDVLGSTLISLILFQVNDTLIMTKNQLLLPLSPYLPANPFNHKVSLCLHRC